MTLTVFFAVLFAALVHASWNGIIKQGSNKWQFMMLLSAGELVAGAVMVAMFPLPDIRAVGWLIASVSFHTLYKFALAWAYIYGDLSRVYPIARGGAQMLVLLISVAILAPLSLLIKEIRMLEIGGILLISVGILTMARGVFTGKESRALLPFALLAAVATAGYSITDGLGGRVAGSVSGYVGWLFLLDGIIFIGGGLWLNGRGIASVSRGDWGKGLTAGGLSVVAYWIAVWAMTIAPIALVSALRETSVAFALLIGVFILKERLSGEKIVAMGFILLGLVFMRI